MTGAPATPEARNEEVTKEAQLEERERMLELREALLVSRLMELQQREQAMLGKHDDGGLGLSPETRQDDLRSALQQPSQPPRQPMDKKKHHEARARAVTPSHHLCDDNMTTQDQLTQACALLPMAGSTSVLWESISSELEKQASATLEQFRDDCWNIATGASFFLCNE